LPTRQAAYCQVVRLLPRIAPKRSSSAQTNRGELVCTQLARTGKDTVLDVMIVRALKEATESFLLLVRTNDAELIYASEHWESVSVPYRADLVCFHPLKQMVLQMSVPGILYKRCFEVASCIPCIFSSF